MSKCILYTPKCMHDRAAYHQHLHFSACIAVPTHIFHVLPTIHFMISLPAVMGALNTDHTAR